MKDFITADEHYGHEEIISICKRPFKSVFEMDKILIGRNNEVVSKDDNVFHVGDFSIRSKSHLGYYKQIMSKLNGRHHLIIGNHDIADPRFYVNELGFNTVNYPYILYKDYIICHDPALACFDRSKKFLCGHVHDWLISHKNVLNVGVDVHNFYPIEIDSIQNNFSFNLI